MRTNGLYRIAITFLIFLSLGMQTPKTTATDIPAIAKDIGAFLERAAAADEFSGAVLVARNDQVVFSKAYGLANKDTKTPNAIDTKFNIGSMSKMFTAVAVAQLAERGKLSFTDTVGKLLPTYPNKEVAEKVTVHHLLTHTSGMGSYHNDTYFANLEKMKTVADLLPLFADDSLDFEPGSRWQYSNSGYVVLGLIIEKISGQSYFDYVKEHIFKPAGMVNTDSYELDKSVDNIALGYTRMQFSGGMGSGARRPNRRPAKGSPAGGGYSTVEDLLKFSLALRGNKLLSQKYTELVMKGQAETNSSGAKYGYGFGDKEVNGKHIVGHNGGAPGIGANFDIFPELGYTAVVLTNYDPPAMSPVVTKLREVVGK
ncbi:MAG TPA: serine hydrolase domain-containing protein [Pyrinomonadaceae bacterium]|nr:serine hydrolase domain-containing protein [Pyrinomonadaceae bacterium]